MYGTSRFQAWFQGAVDARVPEPNAMSLSTVDPVSLQPSTRVVLLKGVVDDAPGFLFYSNYGSRKARELSANPRAALSFVWLPLERQVRIEGVVSRLGASESEAYFRSRPRASQIGAWVSRQSMVIDTAEALREREAALTQRFGGGEVPMPDFWGGFVLAPTMVEFWQGRRSRLHDRVCFRRSAPNNDAPWTRERLCP